MKHYPAFPAALCLALTSLACFPDEKSPGSALVQSIVPPSAQTQTKKVDPMEEVARGAHLVLTSGCHDCHTPLKMGSAGPEPDMARALSGHPEAMPVPPPPAASGPWIASVFATNTAWSGPWGVSFTANLTPDRETGLGAWTFENFKQAIRTGRHMGQGRPILPPMPYPMYKNFDDEELHAIFSYLRTIPAMKNRVPDPLPPASAPSATAPAKLKHG